MEYIFLFTASLGLCCLFILIAYCIIFYDHIGYHWKWVNGKHLYSLLLLSITMISIASKILVDNIDKWN